MIVLIRAGKQCLHSDGKFLYRRNNVKFIWNWEFWGGLRSGSVAEFLLP